MTAARFVDKKRIRLILLIGGLLLFSIIGLHIWFVNNARGILRQIVAEKSGGKLKLQLSQLSFNFLSNQLQVKEANLVTIDTISQPVTYNIKFRHLTLRVASFWPLILQNKLLLDSIKLQDPQIDIIQWRKDTTAKYKRDDLSIPQEMGKLYNSMLDVLDGFGIRRIVISNARLNLINKMKEDSKPVTVSDINFDLIRTANGTKKRDEYIENEQNVALTTTNQNIVLPGGRHILAFKSFGLELFRKRIVMDSCTLTAVARDSARSSYTIFFKKLSLIGVDFNAMYQYNLIKADSVYCENPLFDIQLNPSDTRVKAKERPDPQSLIRELTGDLDLAFVGVKDAGIHININGTKSRTLFNSNKDDFEMRGLRINIDSVQPVTVGRFDMLVQDYHLYNEDSSTAYTFDSIHFSNNKIALNNFSVTTASTRSEQHNERDFRIPYFELTGLDWYQLIFEQNVNAQEAVLYNPVINYRKNKPSVARKQTNLFASLQTLDSLMTLNKLNVINGEVNASFGEATSVHLKNVHLSLYSNRLLQSTNREGLRGAVGQLYFSSGRLRVKEVTAQLENARYTGKNLIKADKVFISSKNNNIKATINDVYLDNLLLDEKSESIMADGIRWKSAIVTLLSLPAKGKEKGGGMNFKNINGADTKLFFSSGAMNGSTFLNTIQIAGLSKEGNGPLQLKGARLTGNDLSMTNGSMKLKADLYEAGNNTASYISNLQVTDLKDGDSMQLQTPRFNFQVDINKILSKDYHLAHVGLQSPVINIYKSYRDSAVKANSLFPLRIDQIDLSEPDINIAFYRSDSIASIHIPYSKSSSLNASNFFMDKDAIRFGSLSANTAAASFVKRNGEVIGIPKGNAELDLSDIELTKKEGKPFWSAVVNKLALQNPNSIAIGRNKNKLVLQQASIGNLKLSSEYITSFDQLLKANVSAWLRTATGQYIDSNTTLKWYNAGYDYKNKTLSLDSFLYFPTKPRDSVILNSPYQTDYITFQSGAVTVTDFNLEQYKKDSALIANTANITNPVITIYRDKLPPFLSGVTKKLPVNMIKSIAMPVAVQRVNIVDGLLSYTEKNAKSRAEGTFLLTHINGGLANVKNRNLEVNDSLSLALNAYLMDSALINLRVKESYNDSLAGFLMTLRMRPTSLTFLNPVLAPLSNVIIRSGTIDSLHLKAIGRENIALGEMNMFYRNLHIKLVKDGDPDNSTFAQNVASFLANTFVIKKNNKGRTGLVYFERLRDRSFFNYIVKMTFSGMATSIGVKKNSKYIKQYKRELEKKTLPPIEFE